MRIKTVFRNVILVALCFPLFVPSSLGEVPELTLGVRDTPGGAEIYVSYDCSGDVQFVSSVPLKVEVLAAALPENRYSLKMTPLSLTSQETVEIKAVKDEKECLVARTYLGRNYDATYFGEPIDQVSTAGNPYSNAPRTLEIKDINDDTISEVHDYRFPGYTAFLIVTLEVLEGRLGMVVNQISNGIEIDGVPPLPPGSGALMLARAAEDLGVENSLAYIRISSINNNDHLTDLQSMRSDSLNTRFGKTLKRTAHLLGRKIYGTFGRNPFIEPEPTGDVSYGIWFENIDFVASGSPLRLP